MFISLLGLVSVFTACQWWYEHDKEKTVLVINRITLCI